VQDAGAGDRERPHDCMPLVSAARPARAGTRGTGSRPVSSSWPVRLTNGARPWRRRRLALHPGPRPPGAGDRHRRAGTAIARASTANRQSPPRQR
jgi:hypothetical protein